MLAKTLFPLSLTALIGSGVLTRPAAAAPRELVIAHENLVEAGEHLPANLDRLLRRIEEVTGWPRRSLKGKAIVRPAEALAYIKKNRAGFAIVPVHQYVEGRQALKLELLGRAVGAEGTQLYFAGIARRPKNFTLGTSPGIKVAGPEVHDLAWLSIIADETITAERPAKLVEVPSSQAALQALLDKQVDVAIVSHSMWQALGKRAEPDGGGDLEYVFASPRLPPSAVVAVGKHASTADRNKLAAALDRICKESGGEICARMGLYYIQSGETQAFERVVAAYEAARQKR